MEKAYDKYEVNNSNPIGNGKTIDATKCACCGYIMTNMNDCHCTEESIMDSVSPSPEY